MVDRRARRESNSALASQLKGLNLEIQIWRADLLSGILELDKAGTITGVAHSSLYPAGRDVLAEVWLQATRLGSFCI